MISSYKQYVPQDDGVQFVERFHLISRELDDVKHAQNDLENKVMRRFLVFGIIFGFIDWVLCTAAVIFGLHLVTNWLSLAISTPWAIFIVGLPTSLIVVIAALYGLFKSA